MLQTLPSSQTPACWLQRTLTCGLRREPLFSCCLHACAVRAVQHAEATSQRTRRCQVDFSIGSEGAPWLGKRNYSSLTAAAEEVGDSRLFGGVHFPSANADGLKLGRLVGARVFEAFPGGGSSGTSGGSTAKAGRRLMDV